MTKIIKTEFQKKREERNSKIVNEFVSIKKRQPGASNGDCIRGLSAGFGLSENSVRIILKEGGVL